MASKSTLLKEEMISESYIDTTNNDACHISNPVVIHPDSDSDDEPEYSDALENDISTITDELSDVKQRKHNHYNEVTRSEKYDSSHMDNDEEDCFKDAQDDNESDNEFKETEKDIKREELKKRQDLEDRLAESVKEERRQESFNMKKSANELYIKSQHKEAIELYTEALNVCPLCYKEDRAILFANRAAAKLKLETRDGAIEDCCEAIDLNSNYLKAILRRAQIYEDTDRPHESMKDFERVLELDPRHIEAMVAVRRLPEKIKEKDEKLKAEMMDNLKKLGNMCLKPFGLSTDNFQFVQDQNTGGYSVNFKK